ncbi:DUF2793 domain-containing protein [Aquibium sp. ELW1220]|uniref:DUF2793 domain-containing protein n=1 Tax=Aquibium sp. ELW1220 TaxID=2976766 RepID=UPI0025AF5038|nr:DUF2793 domain-containing protein [Aquibium sp. ELW1220]MDN2578973.1 DUF2793 domain-containing protein [Aquibium sp. ELW1220]
MEQTTRLKLPYLLPSQAQKHVTHNEALRALDAIVQVGVESSNRNDPPAEPAAGERHLVGDAPTGAFAGHAGTIAAFQDGAWTFHEALPGWLAWDAETRALLVHDGAGWAPVVDLQSVPMVGVNATADAVNRLTVAAPATLLTHYGAGHQLKINKAEAGDTGSLLFQTGWSGRAEMGLAGNDDFSVKVSPDGADWHTALAFDAETGRLDAAGLTIAPGATGESGLAFADLTAASPAAARTNKTLGVDADGKVVQLKASLPSYVITGTESDTTTIRDFNAQVAKGTGIYLGDAAAFIANNPIGDWYQMTITGVNAGFFSQLMIANAEVCFRGAAVSGVAGAIWYMLMKQSGATTGYVPYYDVAGTQRRYLNSSLYQAAGRMGIGTASPHASALLDLASTQRGFLPPRMTQEQRDAIAAPATGLMIYNLTQNEPQFFDGTEWVGMRG